MDENNLVFDRTLHLLYSGAAKKVILTHLEKHYSPPLAAALWDKIQQTYAGFLSDLPYLGGKKNPQAGSVYDCIALFAYYEALPDKPSFKEISDMNMELFTPAFQRVKFINLNRRWELKAAWHIFNHISKTIAKQQENWPGNYHMEVQPFDPDRGIEYKFHSCPIADFARAHGYLSLMPAMCNPDYPMLAAIHGTLIRTTTCSNGSYCDYRIVGSKSAAAAQNPAQVDAEGYMRNAPSSL